MATRRSNRLAGKILGDDFDEIIARSTNEARHQTRYFRLLDLPPELREYIYAYATVTQDPRPLEWLTLPVLALVSKQVRAEVLPQFFAQQLYENENGVISNYADFKSIAEQRHTLDDFDAVSREQLLSTDERRRKTYGLLRDTNRKKENLEGMRKCEQYLPLFRNVRLKVVTGFSTGNLEHTTFVLSVPTNRALHPQVTLIEQFGGSLFPQELAMTLERVRGKVDDVVKGRESFLGFTFEELELIVKEFCFCLELS
ncbi:hypothetical protein LTR56_024847 [Elasticomyces elasticus]|nr:hypothetical protein LTR56_024847 [Elasticomyces elasticus]KAK3618657.1 hypothetical protein LTR22_026290 [Elasticomyces elasticus]KAK4917540.1 hypothetical protein LTR49_014626 [Elasticomyces elasticus]KAK5756336.1 hypothetical protein LTS12_013525 [Elasticomyces elasticus]